jgi:exopolysaccharide production protein ExoQ
MSVLSRARPLTELGLDLCAFVFLPLLTLFPRGAAGLAGVAGLLAFGLAAPAGIAPWRRLWRPAMLFAALLLSAAISLRWTINPHRGLVMELRLFLLFAAGLALVAAAPFVTAPERLLAWFCAGLVLALVLTGLQQATLGALTEPFLRHVFVEPRLNQVEAGFVILLLPVTASLALRGQIAAAGLLLALTEAVIFLLVGDAAQTAFLAGIAGAALIYLSRRWAARMAAAVAAIVILLAPATFPMLIRVDALARRAETIKFSLWHRLEIWSFVGADIAQRPLLGWGLDSSRAIPGGSALTPEGVPWLPLHPHNVTLQIWLELGLPGAALFALFVARLWLALGAAPWPRLYSAAAGGSLVSACVIALGSYGLWEEWWIGSEFLTLFLILVMAPLAGEPLRKRPLLSLSPSLEPGAARSRR